MLLEIILIIIALGTGFELGRLTARLQLAAIKAEVVKAELSAVAEVKALAAAIKEKL
jgi:hypothetical protein